MKIYLAGPEVFLPNAREQLDRKAALARNAGFIPLSPGDLHVAPAPTMREFGLALSAVNEGMMLEADGIIANLTPWRGISADVGTVYELGFMCALNKACFAYTNAALSHFERVSRHFGGRHSKDREGKPRAPDGTAMEDYGMMDNLMLPGGIEHRGGTVVIGNAPPDTIDSDTAAFEQCLRIMAQRYL